MKPPDDREVFQDELAMLWFDDDGILCAVAKNVRRTIEKQKQTYALIRQITGDKKVCLLSDASDSGPLDKETREYSSGEMKQLFKAMALVANSALGKLVVNTFLTFSGEPVPIKMFADEQEAREWLRQYL